ncbi:MAG: hypothetical protein NWE93_02045 [Candidatus Bathyarchaeota archaeon]|nr:hypothetical protein [Candidatus Bathyarchaeota archaeon]
MDEKKLIDRLLSAEKQKAEAAAEAIEPKEEESETSQEEKD